MIKLTDNINLPQGMEIGKVFTGHGFAFKNENLIDVDKDMKDGKFDEKNPQVHIQGFGVYHLKDLEKAIARDLKDCISGGAEYAAQKLYTKHSVTEAKIKAANDVYEQMETSQYKRAVTMYNRRKR